MTLVPLPGLFEAIFSLLLSHFHVDPACHHLPLAATFRPWRWEMQAWCRASTRAAVAHGAGPGPAPRG